MSRGESYSVDNRTTIGLGKYREYCYTWVVENDSDYTDWYIFQDNSTKHMEDFFDSRDIKIFKMSFKNKVHAH